MKSETLRLFHTAITLPHKQKKKKTKRKMEKIDRNFIRFNFCNQLLHLRIWMPCATYVFIISMLCMCMYVLCTWHTKHKLKISCSLSKCKFELKLATSLFLLVSYFANAMLFGSRYALCTMIK